MPNLTFTLPAAAPAVPFRQVFVRGSWGVLGVAALLQVVLFTSIQNVLAVAAVLLAWLAVTQICLRPRPLHEFPLSTFLTLGFTATQFYFPLLFTLLEGKPLVYNLELPGAIFLHSWAALVVLLAAHAVYRRLCAAPRFRRSPLLERAGLFEAPTDQQLWLMGALGMLATFYIIFASGGASTEVSGSVADKTIQSLIPFSYAPYFLLLGPMYGNRRPTSQRLPTQLGLYTVLMLLVSISRNSRGSFMLGFTSVAFAYGLGLLLGIFRPQLFTARNVLLAAAAAFFVTGPLADLGTAMVIVRGQRGGVATSELMQETIRAYGDKAAIAARRKADLEETGDWDERYLDNVFTARFANLKFNDASLVQAGKISPQDPAMLDYSIDYVLGTFPTPVLTALNLRVDKDAVYSVSIGDYLYLKAGGGTEALGGFRTGHFAGTGMAAFGWWYLLLLFVGIIPVFYLFDRFYILHYYDGSSQARMPRLSLCGLLIITSIFQFLPSESIITIASFLLRGWIQTVLLYVFAFKLTQLIITGRMLSVQHTVKSSV